MLVLNIDEKKYFGDFEEAINMIHTPFEFELRQATQGSEEMGEFMENPHRTDILFMALGKNAESVRKAVDIAKSMHDRNPFMLVIYVVDGMFVPVTAYEVPHIYAVTRPVTTDNLMRAFHEISYWHNLNRSQAFGNNVFVKWYTEKSKISEDSIISMKSEKYGLVITTVNGTFKHSGKLPEFLKSMKSGTFFRCQCNVAVNFKHVKHIYKDRLDMDNGDVITVSRQYRKAVHEFLKNGLTDLL